MSQCRFMIHRWADLSALERMKMKIWEIRRFALIGLTLAGFLIGSSGSALAAPGNDVQLGDGQDLESLLGQFAGSFQEAPVFTDLGGGFYSLSMPLSPEVRESLLETLGSDEPAEKAQASKLAVISVGQAPVLPPNPITTTHGALSDTTFPYTYWVITVNLGTQTVTKSTTFKLTGPGLKFNRTVPVIYGANGIWGIGFRPGSGVGTPGVYTFQGSVSSGGSATTKSFAVHP